MPVTRRLRRVALFAQMRAMNEPNEAYRIAVSALSTFLESESTPDDGRYVFAYTVTIHNVGSAPARLLSRHWIITDADGRVQEVKGEGVLIGCRILKLRTPLFRSHVRISSAVVHLAPGVFLLWLSG